MRRRVREQRAEEHRAAQALGRELAAISSRFCAPRERRHHHGALGAGRVHHGEAVARRTPGRSGAGRGSGPSGRCRGRPSRSLGSGARGTGSASSSGANGRSTRSAAGTRSRLPVAVHLVEQPLAVALDVCLSSGIPSAGLLGHGGARELAPARGRRNSRLAGGHGRASNTRLNGVSAARRKRREPARPGTTSRIRASPAWAPSASPTSWDSDAGVHSSVENAVVRAPDRVEVVLDAVARRSARRSSRCRRASTSRGRGGRRRPGRPCRAGSRTSSRGHSRCHCTPPPGPTWKRTRSATPASCARRRAVSIEPSW